MTLLPDDRWHLIAKAEGPSYKLGPFCSVPGCTRPVDHGHHIVRRSFLKGDYAWISMPDLLHDEPVIVQNKTGLCYAHHEDVTGALGGHRAKIVWNGEWFDWWTQLDSETVQAFLDPGEIAWAFSGPLDPQPALLGALSSGSPSSKGPGQGTEECPTCGKTKRKREELPPGEKRPKKTWAVSVPVDHREDGFAILEELWLQVAELFERDEHKSWRYYTLVEGAALIIQNKHLLERG